MSVTVSRVFLKDAASGKLVEADLYDAILAKHLDDFHRLPQANEFYRQRCGMTDLGSDATKQHLHYFEMTPEQASEYMRGRV